MPRARLATCACALAASHLAGPAAAARSPGCSTAGGAKPTGVPGDCVAMTIDMGYATREYLLCLPSSYAVPTTTATDGGVGRNSNDNATAPAAFPVVVNFHGWGGTMKGDLAEAQVWAAVEEPGATPAVVVHPQGYADHSGGDPAGWGSWHVNGTAESPGPEGPTCTPEGGRTAYCYESCKQGGGSGEGEGEEGLDGAAAACDPDGCDWTTCVDDYAFVTALLDELERSLCIDTAREFATGCSNGGMMAYGLGANLPHRFAAVAPQCASFHPGFLDAPDANLGIPVMDVHGSADTVVPANLTAFNTPLTSERYPLSADGWYYTQVAEIMAAWAAANGCEGGHQHYPTTLDGVSGLYCVAAGAPCARGDVVRCAWDGGHDYFGGSGNPDSGRLVWEFLQQWERPCHVGLGQLADPGTPCAARRTEAVGTCTGAWCMSNG